MPVTVHRDVVFTRIVSLTPHDELVLSAWMPATRIDAKQWQIRQDEKVGWQPLYRINARLKPHQRPE